MPVTCLSEEGPFKRNFIDIVSRGRIPLSPFNKEGTARCLFFEQENNNHILIRTKPCE